MSYIPKLELLVSDLSFERANSALSPSSADSEHFSIFGLTPLEYYSEAQHTAPQADRPA